MAKRGRPPFGNIHTLGLAAAARAVSDRVWSRKGYSTVWLLPDGGLILRHPTERRYIDPGDHRIVGTYARIHHTRHIEDDLAEALRDQT